MDHLDELKDSVEETRRPRQDKKMMDEPQKPIQKTKPSFSRVQDLNPNLQGQGFNLVAKVVEEETVKINRLYLDGTKLKVASVLVGDNTGTIELHLKNEQIIDLKKGDVLILRNAKIQMLKSRMHLRIDAWGLMEKCDPNQYDEPIKMDNNISAIEWELVAPES